MTKRDIEYIKIDDYKKGAINYFIEWYTGKQLTIDKLDGATHAKVGALFDKKWSSGKFGEFIAVAYLIENGWDIGWSNIRLATYGKGEERGVDLFVSDGTKFYFTEVKRNTSGVQGTISSLSSSTTTQLDERIKNAPHHLAHMDGITWLADLNQTDYKFKLEEILLAIDGKGIIVSPPMEKSIEKMNKPKYWFLHLLVDASIKSKDDFYENE